MRPETRRGQPIATKAKPCYTFRVRTKKEENMASALYDKLMADMKDAMKAHNTQALNAVRGVIAKVKDLTVNAGKEITDDVVLAVVAKGVKQREATMVSF